MPMKRMINIFNNTVLSKVFGSLKTHSLRSCHVALSPSARGIEYPFNGKSLAGIFPNSLSANFVKLNIMFNKKLRRLNK